MMTEQARESAFAFESASNRDIQPAHLGCPRDFFRTLDALA
jgi:hypothetical protein